ncbi:MAG: Plug domain-containing protein [Novosphingobium sp.]|nr:Plug domain-containing protein [Novosphingobium sp.]
MPTFSRCFAAASLVAFSSSLHAEEAGGTSTITVTATPDTQRATIEIQQTPGGVEVVSDTRFKNTPVQNIKDILGYVPGVIVQPRMGDDARVSIRGSGLSRAYGARGLAVLLDGAPLNTSDGLIDFFEIDPSAYRYAEVSRAPTRSVTAPMRWAVRSTW